MADKNNSEKKKKIMVPIGEHKTKNSERISFISIYTIALAILIFLEQLLLSGTFFKICIVISAVIYILLVASSITDKVTTEYKHVYENELTEEDKNLIDLHKEKQAQIAVQNKKPMFKNWKFYLIVIAIIVAVCWATLYKNTNTPTDTEKPSTTSAIDDTSTKTTSIKKLSLAYTTDITLNLNDEKSSSHKTWVQVKGDFTIDDLVFISNNPEIATIEYNETVGNSYVYFNIIGVKAGETTVYVQTKDGIVKSEELKVVVTGDNSYKKIEALDGASLPAAISIIQECGYTAKYLHVNTLEDFTTIVEASDETELSKWVIVECKKTDKNNKTAEFTINTLENIEKDNAKAELKEKLEAKLSYSTAVTAVEAYGKAMYPYGFKIHTVKGLLGSEALDENTWFLKYQVTITNAFNAEAKLVCEAKVTGTNDNPEIVDFLVY